MKSIVAALVLLVMLAAGCGMLHITRGSTLAIQPLAPSELVCAPVPNGLNEADLERIRPNEVGRIPVLMYHAIGAPAGRGPRYDRLGLNIRPQTFRKHLKQMYEAGWFPVNMRDALTARLDVPVGKTPVVLTFDDARGTQFGYGPDGQIDPNCAVAILEEFHGEHPDWPLKGTFYVLPRFRQNPAPFFQEGLDGKKLNYLAELGFEIANHSTTHRLMARLAARDLAWEMAQCIRYVKARVPDATMDTMALPGGSAPKSDRLLQVLLKGSNGETKYENRCVVRAWGGATLPPAHRGFDRRNVLRIGSAPGEIERWILRMSQGKVTTYVSDGDPNTVTVPRRFARWVSSKRTASMRIVKYEPSRGRARRVATSQRMSSDAEPQLQ